VIEMRERLTRLLGVRTSPRHRATLTLVRTEPPPEVSRYEINVNALVQFWRVEDDDEVGGTCVVVNRPGTPATGNPSVASFVYPAHAHHIADLHNDWLARKVSNR
jgi:hypothetical protein